MPVLSQVRTSLLSEGKTLPLVVEPKGQLDTDAWLDRSKGALTELLHQHGAILFRGFGVGSAEEFERFIVGASSDEWVEYREAATPRSHVAGHVFTATDYHPDHRIYLHNENSHVTSWPARLFFYCDRPPSVGGETPIADCRKVFARLAPVRDQFLEKAWKYVRSFGYGMGFSWQKVFGASTKAELAAYCRDNFMVEEWLDETHLRVMYRRWAALEHPVTHEDVWFNHGLFYNVWSLSAAQQPFVKAFGADKMPYNTYYGDGARIPDSVLQTLHDAYEAEKVKFRWQPGDVMMIDNMLAAHGRESYEGDRHILVGMTNLIRCEDIAEPSSYTLPASARA